MAWKSSFRQNYRTTFSPKFPTSTAGSSHVVADVEAPGGEKWEHLNSGGKQWQATSKNLPRTQRTGAVPVTWLRSGLYPDRPKGWIPIIIIIIIIIFCILGRAANIFIFFVALLTTSRHVMTVPSSIAQLLLMPLFSKHDNVSCHSMLSSWHGRYIVVK